MWCYASASVVGTSHGNTGTPCQDANVCRVIQTFDDFPVLVAVVSDGAGSAERSQIGAQLACELLLDEVTTLFETRATVKDITKDFCKAWLTRFQNEIASRAAAESLSPRAYACTLLAAAVGTENAVFFQIGDGAIVINTQQDQPPEEFSWVFWPEKGEYANQTFFATDPQASDNLSHDHLDCRVEEVALFTDGLERLALHMESQSAHAPFFRPMFAPLRNEMDGHSERLSIALESFLSSKKVEDQTDDDKTLVLATRQREPQVHKEALVTVEQDQ